MHFCRICRSEKNLKYTTKELRRLQKKQHKDGKLHLVDATTTSPHTQGNICHECEERLHNFLEVDDLNTQEREDSPVIVDDDELLYNLFFKKIEKRKLMIAGAELQQEQLALLEQETRNTVNTEEIVEVLTSGENTPASTPLPAYTPLQVSTPIHVPTAPHMTTSPHVSTSPRVSTPPYVSTPPHVSTHSHVSTSPHVSQNATEGKTLVFIDLESDLDDGEEVIYQPETLPEPESTKIDKIISPISKKHKKIFDETQQRVVATVCLDSSDSEPDNGIDTAEIQSQQPTSPVSVSVPEIPCNILSATTLSTDPAYKCKFCDVNLLNAECLRMHQCLRAGVKCPVCQMNFPASQRLINHMRCKHRSYDDDDTLIERPRCAQDSAMTIRLRYLQRYTYYECQLCGRIDAVFREHKQHVMQQHAAESKSLKDPMMKEVKCPICKEKCGIQYLGLCKHILSTHVATEYKKYLRDITSVQKFHPKKVENARVYKFVKRKNYFYECKICQKVVTGYTNHVQHMSIHIKNKSTVMPEPQSSPPQQSEVKATVRKLNADAVEKEKSKLNNISKKTIPPPFKTLPPPPPLKPKKQNKKLGKPCKKHGQAALVKVKLKPLLRQFPTQKYKCKHCHMNFEGFHRLNLHQINVHSRLEYLKCNACARAFITQSGLEEHIKKTHHTNATFIKHKRKYKANNVASTNCCDVNENCNTDCKRGRTSTTHLDVRMNGNGTEQNQGASSHGNSKNIESIKMWTNAIAWLQDLLELSKRRQAHSETNSATNTTVATQNNTNEGRRTPIKH